MKKVSSGEEIRKIIENEKKAVIKFTASWCKPCKKISPVYKKISEQYSDIKFFEVDIDEIGTEDDILLELEVSDIPLFILIHKKEIFCKVKGCSEKSLKNKVNDLNENE